MILVYSVHPKNIKAMLNDFGVFRENYFGKYILRYEFRNSLYSPKSHPNIV